VTDPLEAGILDPRREPFTDPRVILSRIVPDSLLADDDEPTVADLIRGCAARLGICLTHLSDAELGSRIAAMPLADTDDLTRVAALLS
jgi:hypothetical protein